MKNIRGVYGKYFYGNEISEYGQEHGYVDYRTLAKAFDAVLSNDFMEKTRNIGCWEIYCGDDEYYEDSHGNTYDYTEASNRYYELKAKIEELEKHGLESSEEYSELESDIEALEEEHYHDFYQFFIVDGSGARILQEAGETVWYNEDLDLYVWGVTHWGTSWDYVLTNIPCNTGES